MHAAVQSRRPGGRPAASAKCCTSDLTLAEFRRLRGKMDGANPNARTIEDYLKGTDDWRTDLYATSGTLMTHAESIALFKRLGAKFTPELKAPEVPMPFEGDYTQEQYAQQMIDEYKAAGVDPKHVFAQSFNLNDVRYWIKHEPAFGAQAVYLDGRYEDKTSTTPTGDLEADMRELAEQGVKILAPPIWMLVTLNDKNEIVPSDYAKAARAAGLDIIAWSLERSGPLAAGGGCCYQTIKAATDTTASCTTCSTCSHTRSEFRGVFSDWPATTTFYASCAME